MTISASTALSHCPHRQVGSSYLVTPNEHLLDYLPPDLLQLPSRVICFGVGVGEGELISEWAGDTSPTTAGCSDAEISWSEFVS